jgi:hypothetical protein
MLFGATTHVFLDGMYIVLFESLCHMRDEIQDGLRGNDCNKRTKELTDMMRVNYSF